MNNRDPIEWMLIRHPPLFIFLFLPFLFFPFTYSFFFLSALQSNSRDFPCRGMFYSLDSFLIWRIEEPEELLLSRNSDPLNWLPYRRFLKCFLPSKNVVQLFGISWKIIEKYILWSFFLFEGNNGKKYWKIIGNRLIFFWENK